MTTFTDALATIDTALAALETSLAPLIALTPDQRQQLTKMGDKSEAVCRQAGYVFGENPGILPGNFDLPGYQHDSVTLDALRPRLVRLNKLHQRVNDTEMANEGKGHLFRFLQAGSRLIVMIGFTTSMMMSWRRRSIFFTRSWTPQRKASRVLTAPSNGALTSNPRRNEVWRVYRKMGKDGFSVQALRQQEVLGKQDVERPTDGATFQAFWSGLERPQRDDRIPVRVFLESDFRDGHQRSI